MAFTLDTWRRQLQTRLEGWWSRVERAGATSVYAGLSAATLWPLVDASRKGELVPVALALGAVTSGVGANLIAGQIQRWKDAKRVGEPDLAAWIEERVARDANLRAALDEVLEKLEAIATAQAKLGESDRQAFTDAWRADLERLGHRPRSQAKVRGSGAIAQGKRAVAVGAGGLAAGRDVHGSVVANQIKGNVYVGAAARNRQDALGIYRGVLAAAHRHLPLRGLDAGASDPAGERARLDLAQVYIDLVTRTQIPLSRESQDVDRDPSQQCCPRAWHDVRASRTRGRLALSRRWPPTSQWSSLAIRAPASRPCAAPPIIRWYGSRGTRR